MADFPSNWQIASDFDPNDHLMNLKGRDYLNVQARMLWFIRDQRALIAAGLATQPYVLRTELVELDREAGWAHFMTTARDVLGNESVMYGSEAAKDFTDYIEKASTKSLGRALLGLGYGTAFAPEMDEGERVVDAPTERRQHAAQPRQSAATRPERQSAPSATPTPPRQPAPAQSDAGRPTAAPVRQGGISEWVTADGFNPMSDVATRKRMAAIGASTVDLVESILRDVKATYKVYDHAAIDAKLSVLEERHKQAHAAVKGA